MGAQSAPRSTPVMRRLPVLGPGESGSPEDADRRTSSRDEFRSEISLDATAGRGLRFARFGPTTPGRCEDMSTSPVHALDAAHYTDATRFERERERIFRRTWQFAGHASQLEHGGDCFALDLHGRSLFCVKDRERRGPRLLQRLPAPRAPARGGKRPQARAGVSLPRLDVRARRAASRRPGRRQRRRGSTGRRSASPRCGARSSAGSCSSTSTRTRSRWTAWYPGIAARARRVPAGPGAAAAGVHARGRRSGATGRCRSRTTASATTAG